MAEPVSPCRGGRGAKHIRAHAQRDFVATFVRSGLLAGLDFDGALAPIAADRDRATTRPATTKLLCDVARSYPCAVLPGRPREDVAARLGDAPVGWTVGNTASSRKRATEGCASPFAELVASRLSALRQHLRDAEGLEIEDKRFSLALHHRRSVDRDAACAAILEPGDLFGPDARVVGGKRVVSLLPPGAPKGNALDALRLSAGARSAMHVGDHVTDEDVLAQDEPGRLCASHPEEQPSSSFVFPGRPARSR